MGLYKNSGFVSAVCCKLNHSNPLLEIEMVAYLRLLPILGLFLVDGARSVTVDHGAVDESQTGGSWEYVPGAYIIEYEDGHVSPILEARAIYHDRFSV